MSLLTIGIPAYRRPQALWDVLGRAIDQGICQWEAVETLVIDDDSQDGTYERVAPLNGSGNIRVLRNAQRQGFCGNFGRLIEECQGDYLMFSCDDDYLQPEGIQALLKYLKQTDQPPALVSTLFFDQGAVYRSQSEGFRSIDLAEYRVCCNHLPGIVVHASVAKAIWRELGAKIVHPHNAYPQCCLAAVMLVLGYPAVYAPMETVRTGYALETGITGYASVRGRWEQYLFFHGFLNHLAQLLSGRPEEPRARALAEAHERSLFAQLGNGILNERPDLVSHFPAGAQEFAKQSASS